MTRKRFSARFSSSATNFDRLLSRRRETDRSNVEMISWRFRWTAADNLLGRNNPRQQSKQRPFTENKAAGAFSRAPSDSKGFCHADPFIRWTSSIYSSRLMAAAAAIYISKQRGIERLGRTIRRCVDAHRWLRAEGRNEKTRDALRIVTSAPTSTRNGKRIIKLDDFLSRRCREIRYVTAYYAALLSLSFSPISLVKIL